MCLTAIVQCLRSVAAQSGASAGMPRPCRGSRRNILRIYYRYTIPLIRRIIAHIGVILFLQCAIPVFEGLLPARHDAIIANLLFDLATWHAYAKLRLHTNTSLGFFATATIILGTIMRRFVKKTCAAYDTRELPHEMATRGRCKAAMIKKGLDSGKNMSTTNLFRSEKLQKIFNLVIYKYHALGDYVRTILHFGTTDSYSTQVVGFFIYLQK